MYMFACIHLCMRACVYVLLWVAAFSLHLALHVGVDCSILVQNVSDGAYLPAGAWRVDCCILV